MLIFYVVIICTCLGISFSASAESSVYPLPEAVGACYAHFVFGRSILFFSGFLSILDCLLPFCKVLVILCHNSLCFAVSFHKCLYIRITVIGQNIGEGF